MADARVLHSNGEDTSDELRDLAVDQAPVLSGAESDGLHSALTSLDEGEGRTLDQVRQTIDGILRR